MIEIINCARCGGTHKLMQRPLTNPTGRYNLWAPCPTNGEPIMLLTFKTEVSAQARELLERIQGLERELAALLLPTNCDPQTGEPKP